MSRLSLIKMFRNEPAEIFNKCSKAYELGRKDEREKVLALIDTMDFDFGDSYFDNTDVIKGMIKAAITKE